MNFGRNVDSVTHLYIVKCITAFTAESTIAFIYVQSRAIIRIHYRTYPTEIWFILKCTCIRIVAGDCTHWALHQLTISGKIREWILNFSR